MESLSDRIRCLCARTFGTAPRRLILSRHDEAQSLFTHSCAQPSIGVPLVNGRRRSANGACPKSESSMSSTHVRRRLVTGPVVGVAVIATALCGSGVAAASGQAGIAASQVSATIGSGSQPGLAESSRPVVKRGGAQPGLVEAIQRPEPPKEGKPAPEPEPVPSEPQRVQVAPAPAPVRQDPAPAPVWRAPAPVRQAPAPVRAAPAPAPAPAPQGPAPIKIHPNLPVVPQAPIPLAPFG